MSELMNDLIRQNQEKLTIQKIDLILDECYIKFGVNVNISRIICVFSPQTETYYLDSEKEENFIMEFSTNYEFDYKDFSETKQTYTFYMTLKYRK